jgi:hypothetical protein
MLRQPSSRSLIILDDNREFGDASPSGNESWRKGRKIRRSHPAGKLGEIMERDKAPRCRGAAPISPRGACG